MQATNNFIDRLAREQSLLAGKRFTQAVKKRIFFLLRLRTLFMEDRQKKSNLNWRNSLRSWRHGFIRFHYKLYGLDRSGDPAQYVSDFSYLLTHCKIDGRFSEIVDNKYAFGLLLNRLGMPTPKIKGLIRKGVFYPLDSTEPLRQSEFLQAVVAPGENLVLKPIWGYHGFGFINLARDDKGFRLNGEDVSPSLLAGLIGKLDNFIVTEFVTQGEFSRTLYAHTPNTIRVVTLWDAQNSEAFVARAVLRIGTSRSFPVDNFKAGQGGLSVLIDPVSGELGPGAMADANGKPIWHTHHPESHAPIQGAVIPAWNEVRTRILDYAVRFAFIPCIGWDIILCDGGFSILEGNSAPGMPVLQIHGPMLADPKVKRFYGNI